MPTWAAEKRKKKALLARLAPEEKTIYDTVGDIRRCRQAPRETCNGQCEYLEQDQKCQYNPAQLQDWVSTQVYWYANTDEYDELKLLLFLCHLGTLRFPERQVVVELWNRILDSKNSENWWDIALEPLTKHMQPRKSDSPVDVDSDVYSKLSAYPVLQQGWRTAEHTLGHDTVVRLISAAEAGADLAATVNNHVGIYRGVGVVGSVITVLIVTVLVAWAVATLPAWVGNGLISLVSFCSIAFLDAMFRPTEKPIGVVL